MVGFLIFLGCAIGVGCFWAAWYIYDLGVGEGKKSCGAELFTLRAENHSLTGVVEFQKSAYDKLLSQKKSSEVKTGHIAEQMAPFLNGFPYDPKSAKFLGQPLDFIVFNETGVHFVEVKSGDAQLTKEQRAIKEHIENNRVSFEVYRVK